MTGKEVFMNEEGDIEDLVIEDNLINDEEVDPLKGDDEEYKEEADGVEVFHVFGGALYDKELFAAELDDIDEDVDFD